MDKVKKREIVDITLGYPGVMLMVFLVNLFNRYILMAIPLVVRMFLMFVVFWLIATAPLIIMIIRKEKLSEYGFSKDNIPKQVLIGVLFGVALSVVFTLIPHLVGLGDMVSSGKGYNLWWQFVYEFVYCILAVGLTEEFVFRGFFYTKLERISNPVVALVVSSVMFGLFHIFGGNFIQVIVTTVLGALFCLCRTKIKGSSLLSVAIAHGVYDALIVVLTFVFK